MLLKTTKPRTIFFAATACLAVFGLMGMPSLSSMFDESLFDGVRGALLGASIGLVYLTFRLKRSETSGRMR
jgi:hypothetical protein